TGGSSSVVYTVTSGDSTPTLMGLATMNNRAYFLRWDNHEAVLMELTPTTAAGPASVSELARFPMSPSIRSRNRIWAAFGMVFVSSGDGTVYYVRPGAEYGVLYAPLPIEQDATTLPPAWGFSPMSPFIQRSTQAIYFVGRSDLNDFEMYHVDAATGALGRVFVGSLGSGNPSFEGTIMPDSLGFGDLTDRRGADTLVGTDNGFSLGQVWIGAQANTSNPGH